MRFSFISSHSIQWSYFFLCSIILLVTGSLQAQEFNYLPDSIPGHQIVHYEHFTLSYNELHEQADWVAYELTQEEVALDGNRCNCFAKDRTITSGSATSEHYLNSGFDKGHLAPSADFYQSQDANRHTYLFSNISPQSPKFNQGIWSDLEAWTRTKATQYNKIYIITGPLFINNLGYIGEDPNNRLTIPGYFYKILLRFDAQGKAKTIGFVLPNIGANGTLKDYVVPVNLIETLSGIDFFPALPDTVENKNESQLAPESWGL